MSTLFHHRIPAFIFLAVFLGTNPHAEAIGNETEREKVRVMTFNLWHGGDAGRQPLDQTVEVIKQAQADIVGFQETAGAAPEGQPRPDNAAKLAEKLGWHYFDQGGRTGIISRFKFVASTPNQWGAKFEMPSGQQFYMFNAHLSHSPYQPYQLLGIPYGESKFLSTAVEAVRAAEEARGEQVKRMLAEVNEILAEGLPVFITGDFNEPSHLDWTAAAAQANLCPTEVQWPSTKAVEEAGFLDTWRAAYPDPVQQPGLTWTPTTQPSDPKDHHDRIDFVFAGGAKVEIKSVKIVGESKDFADIVVTPYPSDHRAVVAEVELPEVTKASRPEQANTE